MEKFSDFPSDLLAAASGVSFAYPLKQTILSNINLAIRAGTRALLIGENGAGKTSLLKLLRGDLLPVSGKIGWRDGDSLSASRIVARKMTAIITPSQSQKYAKSPLSVAEVLLRGLPDEFSGHESSPEEATATLDYFSALNLWDKKLSSLSQGQSRLILLCRALLRDAPLLLLDEFADGLDAASRNLVLGALEKFSERGAIIMSSHRREAIPSFIAESWEIRSGELRTRDAIRACPTQGSNVVHPPVATGGELAIIENADVYIRGKKILENINWKIRAGEHWRVAGANGAGKSTLLRLLAGDEMIAYGGKISRFDKSGKKLGDLASIRKSVRLVSFKSQLEYSYPLSCLDFILSGFDNSVGKYREYTPEEIAEALELSRFFSLADYSDVSIRELSTGQLARLSIARALVGTPDLLLLDEACSGLDAESRDLLLKTLNKIAAGELGKRSPGLVVVSHYDADIPSCANRFATMERGRLRVL